MPIQLEFFYSPWAIRVRSMAQSIWKNRWFGWLMIGGFALWYAWWSYNIPSPAKAASVLAVIAAIMPFRGEPEGFEKFFWTIVLFAFLFMELRAIDHKEHVDEVQRQIARTQEAINFNAIGTGITAAINQSQTQFQKTTSQASSQFDATMNKAGENLNHMTGGDSYPVITMLPIPLANTMNKMRVILTIAGKNPLFDVEVNMRTLPQPKVLSATEFITNGREPGVITQLDAPSISPTRANMLPVPIEPSLSGQSDYRFTTVARNGTFTETLHVRNLGNVVVGKKGLELAWEQSYEIILYNGRTQRVIKKFKWHKTFAANSFVMPQQPN